MIVLRWIMITVRRVTQAYCCMQDIAMSNHEIRNIGMFQARIGATSKKHIANIYSAQIYTPGISPKPTVHVSSSYVTSWKRTFFFPWGQFETIEAMDSMKLQLHAGPQGDGKEIHVDNKKVSWLELMVFLFFFWSFFSKAFFVRDDCIIWNYPPTQDASHHQDDIAFLWSGIPTETFV